MGGCKGDQRYLELSESEIAATFESEGEAIESVLQLPRRRQAAAAAALEDRGDMTLLRQQRDAQRPFRTAFNFELDFGVISVGTVPCQDP